MCTLASSCCRSCCCSCCRQSPAPPGPGPGHTAGCSPSCLAAPVRQPQPLLRGTAMRTAAVLAVLVVVAAAQSRVEVLPFQAYKSLDEQYLTASEHRAAIGGDDDDYDTSTLRLVHAIFRHGQRTPADTYPNDPYEKFDFAPVGWGQLTLTGKRDQYEQGRWLRRRYGRFLGDLYHPDVTTVLSTDVDRTRMSAMLAMAGLWPPAPEQRWHPTLDWQPVPVRSQPLDKDDLLLVRVPCARYDELRAEVLQSPPVRALLQDQGGLLSWLSEQTGMKIADPDDVQSLYSTLKAEEGYNLTLPEWTREVYPHALEHLTAVSFEINALTREMQRIKGGPLVKQILEQNTARAAGSLRPERRRMFVYAGHDSTVSNFLITMGAWDTQIPGYGVLVLVELHEDPVSHEHGVKLFLRNSTAVPPYPLNIEGCGHFCPLKRLTELTRDVIPESLEQACVAKDPNYTPAPPSGP
ncbi:Prostatic acid phosphatase [Frankliniella fusca]|uniref:Prostatic acid phosphatase n=1 Tax=Frankliniella fusca TaxID=407009 RepID=A0AAE1HQV9_9NEOP|nr:Prostatic acid phosphatase [Frankliniella fusca]